MHVAMRLSPIDQWRFAPFCEEVSRWRHCVVRHKITGVLSWGTASRLGGVEAYHSVYERCVVYFIERLGVLQKQIRTSRSQG